MSRIQLTLCTLLLGFSFSLKAQTLETDSLALLDIYLATNGDSWTNNTNWTSGPVASWFGITVSGDRVTKIELSDNNLVGAFPASFNNLNVLQELVVDKNQITQIPDLLNLFSLNKLVVNDNLLTTLPLTASSILLELRCENNALEFDDLEPFAPLVIIDFSYAPQAKIGIERFQYASENDDATLTEEAGGTNNFYFWLKDGVPIGPSPIPFPDITLTNLMESDEGVYTVEVTNFGFPDLTLESRGVDLRLFNRDSLGGEYVPNHLIIEFTDDATQFEKDTLLDYYQATRIDVCMCGVIELWLLPDTAFLPGGQIVIGVEGIKDDAMTKSKVEDESFNYALFLTEGTTSGEVPKELPSVPLPPPVGGSTKVAVVDVGIDYTISGLFLNLWQNPLEQEDGMDEDDNCLVDDIQGYNFSDRNNDPRDAVNGHGTHIAGIILGFPAGNPGNMELINVRTHGDDGLGLLFEAVCGIYYAAQKDARVINLSWGYNGLLSTVFESSIRRAGADCGALFVTSAGNKQIDNDTLSHYPSGFELPNVIAVAALRADGSGLLSQSSFGLESVDIAAPGEDIVSVVSGGALEAKSGTSMAAAAVSRVAAQLYDERPDLTYLNIREAILSSAQPLAVLSGQLATGGILDPVAAMDFIENAEPNLDCLNSVGVEEILAETSPHLIITPQPFSDQVQIEMEWPVRQTALLRVFDSVGKPVFEAKQEIQPPVFKWTFDGSDLPVGMYFVQIQVGKKIISGRLVKN
jgi:hypothetical protein